MRNNQYHIHTNLEFNLHLTIIKQYKSHMPPTILYCLPPPCYSSHTNNCYDNSTNFVMQNKTKILVHKFCSNTKTTEKSCSTNLVLTKNTQNTKTTSRHRMICQQRYNNSKSNNNYINNTILMKIIGTTMTNTYYKCNCTTIYRNYTITTHDAFCNSNYVNHHQYFY